MAAYLVEMVVTEQSSQLRRYAVTADSGGADRRRGRGGPRARDNRAGVPYGVDNSYLIEPLINSLAYASADHIRRQAAVTLRTFVADPRVKTVLAQAQASDASEIVREAAQRTLSTDEEVDQRALPAFEYARGDQAFFGR